MTVQFSVQLADKPGALADLTEKLARHNINIDGIAGVSANGKGIIKLYFYNPEPAEIILKKEAIDFEKQEVLEITLIDVPGQVSELSRLLGDEGINIESFYITMTGTQVIHTNNLKRTEELVEKLTS